MSGERRRAGDGPAVGRSVDAAGGRVHPGHASAGHVPADADTDAGGPALDPSSDAPGAPPDPTVPVAEALGLTPASEVGRASLNRAKAAARARGLQPGRPGARTRGRSHGPPELSGAGKDGRDPTLVGDTLARMATERGWTDELSVAGVVGRWRELVGDQVADHCAPETFDDGLLVVRTDSTAWATNLRMLVPELLARLEKEVGPDVVREVRVLGPAGPGWGKGPRRVPGRGPRDTYG